jgi:hypothetical protein
MISVLIIIALAIPSGKALTALAQEGLESIGAGDPDKQLPPDTDVASVTFTPTIKIVNGVPVLTKYDNYVLENGLWYDQHTRIYSVGGKNRVVEIANFPRAYKDTAQHVYTSDVKFRVEEADLNYYDENRNRFYQDSKGVLIGLGKQATHYIGESLPGAFPMWLEYPTIQPISNSASLTFDITNLVSDAYFKSGVMFADDASITYFTGKEVNSMISAYNGKAQVITLDKAVGRKIMYLHFVRKFYDGN